MNAQFYEHLELVIHFRSLYADDFFFGTGRLICFRCLHNSHRCLIEIVFIFFVVLFHWNCIVTS